MKSFENTVLYNFIIRVEIIDRDKLRSITQTGPESVICEASNTILI